MTTSVDLKEINYYVGGGVLGKINRETLIEVVKMFPDEEEAKQWAARGKTFGHDVRVDGRFAHVPYVPGVTLSEALYALPTILDDIPYPGEEYETDFYGPIQWKPRRVTRWHGDLSFENIIISDFITYIDWRATPNTGDVHYEYAKLVKSTMFDHRRAHECTDEVLCPHDDADKLREMILNHAESRGLVKYDVMLATKCVLERMSKYHMHTILGSGFTLGHCLLKQAERL